VKILVVYQRYEPGSLTARILDFGFQETELLEEEKESQFARAFLHFDGTRIATMESGERLRISGEESEMTSWLTSLGLSQGASLVHTSRL